MILPRSNLFACTRLGIHGFMEVSMLIGFAIVMAGAVLAMLSDTIGNTTNTIECVLSDILLYKTGAGRAYFAASVSNVGSDTITSANVTFFDDGGRMYGFYNDTLAIKPGQTLEETGSFLADITPRNHYMIGAFVSSGYGSMSECSTVHKAG